MIRQRRYSPSQRKTKESNSAAGVNPRGVEVSSINWNSQTHNGISEEEEEDKGEEEARNDDDEQQKREGDGAGGARVSPTVKMDERTTWQTDMHEIYVPINVSITSQLQS